MKQKYFCLFFSAGGDGTQDLVMLGKCSTTELHPSFEMQILKLKNTISEITEKLVDKVNSRRAMTEEICIELENR
jgi:hypothetical protein